MKRLIALILSVVIMLACGVVCVYAESSDVQSADETVSYESLGSGAVTLNCKYSDDGEKIEISGNVNYNVLVSYGKYTVGILRIAPFQSIDEAINAEQPDVAAEMNIAAKFSFTVDIKNTLERFSKYAVVIISPEREIILASNPVYVDVASSYDNSSSNRNEFKGVAASELSHISTCGDMGFGSAVIPVYYDKLINASMNGYIYAHGDSHLFFDKEYIDALDAKIRTYSVSGARVYIQLLMPSNESAKEGVTGECYIMPDVYDEETLSLLYTYIKFIVSRYSAYTDGLIGGIIVGRQIDKNRFNACGGLSYDKYAEKYAFYMSVVANTARLENPDIDIIAPLSDIDCYERSVEVQEGDYLPSELIEKISSVLDNSYNERFDFNIMIESDANPIYAVEADETDGEKYTIADGGENLNLDLEELSRLDAFLSKINKKYSSAPEKYIYYWSVNNKIQGNILECSYAYIYYTLLKNNSVSSFIISFDDNSFTGMDGIRKTVRLIDTKEGKAQCDALLGFFGVSSWNEIISNYNSEGSHIRNEYKSKAPEIYGEYTGSFAYFDFSTGDFSDWYGGAYSKSVKADYGDGGNRVLRQTVSRARGIAHSDIFCIYEYDENYIYTPSLNFKMKITDGEPSSQALYEVTVTIGTKNNSISKKQVVSAGEAFDIWLDISPYAENNKASYIKISTRSITGEVEEYSLWVNDILGYSSEYSSEELNQLISEERRSIRDQSNNNDKENTDSVIYWIVFSIILSAVVIGGILLIVLRRDETKIQK